MSSNLTPSAHNKKDSQNLRVFFIVSEFGEMRSLCPGWGKSHSLRTKQKQVRLPDLFFSGQKKSGPAGGSDLSFQDEGRSCCITRLNCSVTIGPHSGQYPCETRAVKSARHEGCEHSPQRLFSPSLSQPKMSRQCIHFLGVVAGAGHGLAMAAAIWVTELGNIKSTSWGLCFAMERAWGLDAVIISFLPLK